MSSPVRFIGWRYLRARRQEGFISLVAGFSFVGIMLGVATLIIVMSVMNGFRAEFLKQILGFNGHLSVYSQNSNGFVATPEMKEKLHEVHGVRVAMPIIERQGIIKTESNAYGVIVHGITEGELKSREAIPEHIVEGTLQGFDDNEGVVLGSGLARKLRVRVGDAVTIVSPQGDQTAMGTVPRMKSYHVRAIYQVGMSIFDSNYAFISLASAQLLYKLPGCVSTIEIYIDDVNMVPAVQKKIEQQLGNAYFYRDWKKDNTAAVEAMRIESNVMFLILTLIILIATFNIISSMMMLVKDKRRDIAILRTMGATEGLISRIFLMIGSTIGISGALIGALLAMLFCWNIERIRGVLESLSGTQLFSPEIYYLTQLPAVVDYNEVVRIVGMTIAFSVLASWYPARRAARMNPVEALRYE